MKSQRCRCNKIFKHVTSPLLTACLAQRSTHYHEDYSMSETEMVLLGVFKHRHLNFCKRDLRTPAREYNVIMSAWIIVRSGTLDVDIRGVPFIEGFFISGDKCGLTSRVNLH
jgi:hypothetical protein